MKCILCFREATFKYEQNHDRSWDALERIVEETPLAIFIMAGEALCLDHIARFI